MADFDLITDILQRLTAKGVPVPATVAHAVDCEARREWGGRRHYIPLRGEVMADQISARDVAIRKAFGEGATVRHLSQQWHISARRIRQIVTR